jgi:hypothetical protein
MACELLDVLDGDALAEQVGDGGDPVIWSTSS